MLIKDRTSIRDTRVLGKPLCTIVAQSDKNQISFVVGTNFAKITLIDAQYCTMPLRVGPCHISN